LSFVENNFNFLFAATVISDVFTEQINDDDDDDESYVTNITFLFISND